MRSQHNGTVEAFHVPQRLPDLPPRHWVHTAGRLIQKADRRAADHGKSKVKLPPVAPTQRFNQLIRLILHAGHPYEIVNVPLHHRIGNASQAGKEVEHLLAGHLPQQRRLLAAVADVLLVGAQVVQQREAALVEVGVARAGQQVAAEHAEGGRLAGAVDAQQAEALLVVHAKGHAVHGGQIVEALGQLSNRHQVGVFVRVVNASLLLQHVGVLGDQRRC